MATAASTSRPSPRSETVHEKSLDPREAAKIRAMEIRGHIGDLDEGPDKFFIPPEMVPDGWSYEWKKNTVYGQEDPAYEVSLARTGWTPVPASRHPSLMPANYKGETIDREGVRLYERPQEITDEVRRIDLRRAKAQVRTKEEQLSAAPQGQFERQNKDASLVKIRKNVEPMAVPED